MKNIWKNTNKRAFWLCLITSVLLIVAGFLCPPLAVIDGSVLTAVGELAGFGTLAVIAEAIGKGSDIKFSKGDMSVEVDNPDDEQQ